MIFRRSLRHCAAILALISFGCAHLPQAPAGPVPSGASLELREYKIRKHHVEDTAFISVSGEVMNLDQLQEYFSAQGFSQEAGLIAKAQSGNRKGLVLTILATALLAPVGVGFFLPAFMYPAFIRSNDASYVKPAVLQYNAALSRRWLGLRDESVQEPLPAGLPPLPVFELP